MANWCSNMVVFEGNPEAIEQIQQLFQTMKGREEKEEQGQLPDFVPNTNGGYFFNIYWNDGDKGIYQYETKWSPNIEVLKTIDEAPPAKVVVVDREFDYIDGLVLGLTEGVTEYLPISSTGHMIVVSHFMGMNREVYVPNHKGQPILIENKKGADSYYTYKDAVNAYIVVIQIGAILAVMLMYRDRLLTIVKGFVQYGKGEKEGFNLGINLIISFLPAAILGVLLHDWIKMYLFNTKTVIISLLIGAVWMYWVERRREASTVKEEDGVEEIEEEEGEKNLELKDLSRIQALGIGCVQCLALIPGMSRSMTTLIGGYWVGLAPQFSAEYTFLLGFITLSAASIYEFWKSGSMMLQVFDFGPLLFGILIAFISAAIAIKWFVNYIVEKGLMFFVYYRIVLAGVLMVLLWMGQ